MASQTPRRALSPRDVNSPIKSPIGSTAGDKASRAEKSKELGETLLQQTYPSGEMRDAVCQEIRLVGTKRRFDYGERHEQDRERATSKKQKGGSALQSVLHADAPVSRHVDNVLRDDVSQDTLPAKSSVSPVRRDAATLSFSSPVTASPTSSGGFSEAALNDTQLTEPDESRGQPIQTAMTRADARQKAEALKFRLRLANYKVRTNQIYVPFSRLEIRTTGALNSKYKYCQSLPSPRTNPEHRTPFPSIIPKIQLQEPSSEKASRTEISSSPPPVHHDATSPSPKKKPGSPMKEGEETCEEFATPMLPRHRQGLQKGIWNEKSPAKELTSSIVKRGTADALLSLKLQR